MQSNITELMRRKEVEKQLLEAKVAAETAAEVRAGVACTHRQADNMQ